MDEEEVPLPPPPHDLDRPLSLRDLDHEPIEDEADDPALASSGFEPIELGSTRPPRSRRSAAAGCSPPPRSP